MATIISFAAPAVATASSSPTLIASIIGGSCVLAVALFSWATQRSEKKRERTMALRKDVYLPMAASIPGVVRLLMKLTTVKELDDGPMAEFAACANKLAAVAETSTAILITEVGTTLGIEYFSLLGAARPALQALNKMERTAQDKASARQKADRLHALIDEIPADQRGENNPAFIALRNNSEYYERRVQVFSDMGDAAQHEHTVQTLNYLREVTKRLPILDQLRIRLMLALRRDMDIKTDEAIFHKECDLQSRRMQNALDVMIEHFQKVLDARTA